MKQIQEAQNDVGDLINQHKIFKALITKLGKDNIGMLAAFVSWSILTSIVPIAAGLVAITGFILRDPATQANVINHLSQALQGAIPRAELEQIVKTATNHTGLFGIIGLLGIFWGGSNVGGSLSTAFQAIFEVPGRNFIKEKLIDIGMIFVFTALMLVILAGTTAGALINRLVSGFALPGIVPFAIGTLISIAAAFLLFAAIFLVFPPIKPAFRWQNVWKGALLSAILFEILTYIWPIYSHFSHFNRYGAVLASILVLTAWIYFFSMITMLGAELVAVWAIRDAQAHGESVGPAPENNLPQHRVLRGGKDDPFSEGGAESDKGKGKASSKAGGKGQAGGKGSQQASILAWRRHAMAGPAPTGTQLSDEQVERNPAFWLLAATPLVVATLAGAVELLSPRKPA